MNFSIKDFEKLGCVNVKLYIEPLNKYLTVFNINTIDRLLCFLPNLLHESGDFRYVEELASGDAYDTRVDLGNTPQRDGDGRLYKGRGLGQITGKRNYNAFTVWCKQKLNIDINFVKFPQRLKEPEFAVLSSFWFWEVNKLEKLADAKNFRGVCSVWNTGRVNATVINGWNDRVVKLNRVSKLLKDILL